MFKTVLIPVDVSIPADAQKLIVKAMAIADPWDCDLHVVTVVPDAGMAMVGSYLDSDFEHTTTTHSRAELDGLIAETGVKAQPHVLMGTIYDRIIGLSRKVGADLILIGAHQPALKDYLLGSNAARLVRHSNVSVLVLRDDQ